LKRMNNLRIALADDHLLYTEALTELLSASVDPVIEVVGVARNGDALLDILEEQTVDLVLLDLNMPDSGGLDVLPTIKSEYPFIKVIVVTMYDNSKFIKEVLNTHRGDAYFLKTNGFLELLEAIRAVMRDEIYLSVGLKVFPKDFHENGDKQFEDEFQQRHRLTPRETQILKLISLAMTYKEIADRLYISDQTVMVHKKNIMRKLNMNNTAGLVKFALDHNLS
jgi:DNA-binding NarL/FixJ family response regulator